MLYSVVAAFGMKSLPSHHLATFVFLMIWMRNAIAPVVGSSIYNNWLNYKQQYYISRLAQGVDNENTLAASTSAQTRQINLAAGKSSTDAERLAATAQKGRVTIQATITAMKDISGQTVILVLGAAAVVLVLPYHRKETT